MKIEELKAINKLVEELRAYRHVGALMKAGTFITMSYWFEPTGKTVKEGGGQTHITLNAVDAGQMKFMFESRVDATLAKLKQYGIEE